MTTGVENSSQATTFARGGLITSQYATPADAGNVVFNQTGALILVLVMDPAGPLGTLNLQLPANPFDGQIFMVTCSVGVATFTHTNGALQANFTSNLTAGQAFRYVYNQAQNKWFSL